jgi:hypothetical protein
MRSCLFALFCVAFAATTPAETLLPLETEDAELLPAGRLELAIGSTGRFGFHPPFRSAERDYQWTTPTIGLNAGLGARAEVQVKWDALMIDDEGESPKSGAGDARFLTKVRVFSDEDYDLRWLPATAIRFGLKLPSASAPDGLGTDETDVFGELLLSRSLGPGRVHGNVGVGVLGNPGATGGQDDVLLYGLAFDSEEIARPSGVGLRLFGELSGVEGSRFDNVHHRAMGGLRLGGETLAAYLGAGAGLNERSEDFLVRFGLVYRIRVFEE